jgi:hypothetical protein
MFEELTISSDANVRVEAPWAVYSEVTPVPGQIPACPRLDQTSACVHVSAAALVPLYIVTADPNAPGRNVYIEAASACP